MSVKKWKNSYSNNNEVAEVLKNTCSKIIKILWIPQNVYFDFFIGNVDDPRPRIIVKYPKHPSIFVIEEEECKKQKSVKRKFFFKFLTCNTWGTF